ncbi:MAG: tetratricopeptide repeat protein, partial [Armatimonadetes bacterium]|nr:tetratricopeptide repeat protein [Armatimonadota bacterium]
PGLGKSRLSVEFEKEVASLAPTAAVRKGQCVPYGSTTAFQPLAEAIRGECGILDSDPPSLASEKLMAALSVSPTEGTTGEASTGRDEPDQLFERVSFALGLAHSDRFSEMDPKNVKEEIFWGLRKFLEKRAALHPLILVFDDVHWADPSLLEFVEYLAERCEAVPLLILALSRPDLMDKRPTWGAYKKNYTSIFLEPLDRERSLQLLGRILKTDELPDRLREVIVVKAEGNPFYVEEILRMLIEDGILVQEAGAWRAIADLVEGRIPNSIQALMAARIDRLQVEEKRVLQEASAVGRLFWKGALQRLAVDLSQEVLESTLRSLEVKELLAEHDDSQLPGELEWAFNHILVRDVAYESVPRARRAVKHVQVARWIEEKAADRREAFLETLAYHWEQAALVDLEMGALLSNIGASADTAETSVETRKKAVQYLKLAGDKAKSMQSNQEANGFYNRASTIMNSLLQEDGEAESSADLHSALLCGQAEVLEGLGQYDRAIEQMETVRERWRQLGRRGMEGDSLRLLGSLYRDKGDLAEAERLARLALDCLTGEDQVGAKGETLLLMGKVFHDLGQPGESRRWAESALKLAQEVGDRRLELATLPLLGTLNLHRGKLAEAEELYHQATRLARDVGDKRLEGSTLYSLGNVDLNQGDLDASEEHLREAIAVFREMANRRGEAWC